jgi:hypothetical protein
VQNPSRGNSSPKTLDMSVIFNKLPKLDNDHLGEFSPNLFTLSMTDDTPETQIVSLDKL